MNLSFLTDGSVQTVKTQIGLLLEQGLHYLPLRQHVWPRYSMENISNFKETYSNFFGCANF